MVDSRAGSMSVPIRALRCPLLRRSLAVDDNLIAGNAMNETKKRREDERREKKRPFRSFFLSAAALAEG